MNANSGWLGQQVFPQMPQQNHQVTGSQQGQIYPGFQNEGVVNQPMNLGQQVGGQQIGGQQFGGQHLGGQHPGGQQVGGQMINPMFHADRAPHRHVEAYQQVPDPQPPHRQDADAY